VLFSLGRLYASDENPGMDFARSLYFLKRLNSEFPKSRFRAEAQVWVGLLEKLYSLEVDLMARTEDQLSLEREIAKLRADHRELESRDKRLSELESLIKTQKQAIEALRQQLKRMKEIDIQSEKKAKRVN